MSERTAVLVTAGRCPRRLHFEFDAERQVIRVRCRNCTQKTGVETFHEWSITALMEGRGIPETLAIPRKSDPEAA